MSKACDHILYALYGSFPDLKTGYSVRSHNIVKALQAKGIQVSVATRAGFPGDCRRDEIIIHDGITYHRLGQSAHSFVSDAAYRVSARKKYAEFIRKHGITLVHAASNAMNAWPAVMAAADCGVPSVYEYRGIWHYSRWSMVPWHNESPEFLDLQALEIETGLLADRVIAISQALADHLARLGIARSKISVAPNAVDTDAYAPLPPDQGLLESLGLAGRLVIGFAGTVTVYEGLDQLIDVTLGLRAGALPASLLIVGDGADLNRLKKLAQERCASAAVIFTGRVNGSQIPRYYSIMDAVAVPRINSRVCRLVPSLKPQEAMAFARPVIAPRLPVFTEMIRHDETGLLYDPDDPSGLYQGLKNLLESRELREKLGKNGRAWIAGNRTWDQITDKFLNVYQSLGISCKSSATAARFFPLARHPETGGWLRVATIMDEFNYRDYRAECLLLQLEPGKWQAQLEKFRPDLLFVESAWKGAHNLWQRQLSGCTPLAQEIFAWCRERGIPTAFWCKEDPIHFDTFLKTAALADFIFTTDLDCVPVYKRETGNSRVYFLPFACQPRNHNPVEKFGRLDKFCFAGSYYRRYSERQRIFANIYAALAEKPGIDIYDRQFGMDDYFYQFPEEYAPNILGSLPPERMDEAYKGYACGLSMNSITQSQSMFARRAFELCASNTLTASNYSKGQRNLLGPFAICSDNPAEIRRKLAQITATETGKRKFLLAGLRHVLLQHTTRKRLEYISQKIWGIAPDAPPVITVAARADMQAEADILIAAFRRQNWPAKRLLLCGTELAEVNEKDIEICGALVDAQKLGQNSDYVALMAPAHYYGPNYLTDLALAFTYSEMDIAAKMARYRLNDGQLELVDGNSRYRPGTTVLPHCAMFNQDAVELAWHALAGNLESVSAPCFYIDEFNFIENGACSDSELRAQVDDAPLEEPVSVTELQAYAETLAPAPLGKSVAERLSVLFLPEPDQAKLQAVPKVKARISGLTVRIESSLKSEERALIRGKPLARETVNLKLTCQLNVRIKGSLQLKIMARYLDPDMHDLGTEALEKGVIMLRMPEECAFMAFDCEIQGPGEGAYGPFYAPRLYMDQDVLHASSDVAIMTKRYPDYDDIYNYVFVHNRMLGYKELGKKYELIKFPSQQRRFREFEDIDVSELPPAALYKLLDSGRIKVLGIHLINRPQWEAVRPFLDRIKLVIWVHGADIRHWKRKECDFADLDKTSCDQIKRNAARGQELFREILGLQHPKIHYVFVSRTLLAEAEEDVGARFPADKTHVIHNFINSDFFQYEVKDPEARFNVLVLRSFASRTYAGDLAVQAIQHLRSNPIFNRFNFSIYGDGPLFDNITAPLRNLKNVRLEKRFLQHEEMRAVFRTHGVCLTPTRLDSQGVSRDEAMACGLVPITTRISAVPEFVDEACGFLAPPENAMALADAMLRLADDPELFLRMSTHAGSHVRRISNWEQTIAREIALIENLAEKKD